MATLPLVTMTSEMKQCTGRWKLTAKGSQCGIILRSPARVASDLRSLHKRAALLLVLLTDCAKERLPVGGNPGKAVDSPANQILKMARFQPSRARLHASFSRGWGVRCSINYSVQDCSSSRLQSFDQWRLQAELRIDATTPLPHKNFVPYGVDIAPVKFSIVPANNLASIFVFKILNC